ncbi:MAG: type II toxin-antitoxin system VapB family antitoxin [Micropepsaceae bacterium]
MSLNIKNPEAHKLATELAQLIGVSLTEAVTQALREKLDRVKKREPDPKLLEDMERIAHDCASRLSPEVKAIDHGEYLYDEMGLPK